METALEPLHSLVIPGIAEYLLSGAARRICANRALADFNSGESIRLRGSGVRDHAGDLIVIGIRDDEHLAQLALRLGELGRKDMAHLGLVPLDLAGTSLGEALGRARMGLQFGHCFLDFGRLSLAGSRPLLNHFGNRETLAAKWTKSVYRRWKFIAIHLAQLRRRA